METSSAQTTHEDPPQPIAFSSHARIGVNYFLWLVCSFCVLNTTSFDGMSCGTRHNLLPSAADYVLLLAVASAWSTCVRCMLTRNTQKANRRSAGARCWNRRACRRPQRRFRASRTSVDLDFVRHQNQSPRAPLGRHCSPAWPFTAPADTGTVKQRTDSKQVPVATTEPTASSDERSKRSQSACLARLVMHSSLSQRTLAVAAGANLSPKAALLSRARNTEQSNACTNSAKPRSRRPSAWAGGIS